MDIDLSTEAKKARRKALVAALRSGEYEQGYHSLCLVDSKTKKERYCCLGVASVLVRLADGEIASFATPRKLWRELRSTGVNNDLNMTSDIRDAYGFTDSSGGFYYTSAILEKFPRLKSASTWINQSNRVYLTTLNDSLGWSFKEIADLIEYEPEGMFTD